MILFLVELFLLTMSAFITVFFALVALNANFQLVTLQEPPQIDTGNTVENLIARWTNSVNALANNVATATSSTITTALFQISVVVSALNPVLKITHPLGKFTFFVVFNYQ